MAFDAFLKIATIPGESTDDKHKDWIEILSYGHGLTQPAAGSISGTGSLGGGRVDHGDFTIVHHLDKASPKLAVSCCKGEHIGDVTIELSKAGGDKNKYMVYKLTDTMVRNVRSSGDAKSGADLPSEEVSFAYAKIEWTYTAYDNKGKSKGDTKGAWDLSTNKGG